jgi:hypothetical protein
MAAWHLAKGLTRFARPGTGDRHENFSRIRHGLVDHNRRHVSRPFDLMCVNLSAPWFIALGRSKNPVEAMNELLTDLRARSSPPTRFFRPLGGFFGGSGRTVSRSRYRSE